ncbi:hypothetical protein [Aquitalea pelogenes]|uniref:hypothetical protein n=1 Tax=Aquitalea pelogenes TaxID=1293573 RepID=UPI0035B1B50C
MIRKIILLSTVLSLTACASVQSTLEKVPGSFTKAVQNITKPNTPTATAPAVQGEAQNVMYGKVLALKKKSPDAVSLVIQLTNGATFSLPAGADAGFKVGQKVKIVQVGHDVSVEAI